MTTETRARLERAVLRLEEVARMSRIALDTGDLELLPKALDSLMAAENYRGAVLAVNGECRAGGMRGTA